jgi:uncharacterized protein YndB with AHSA1/START domain
MEHVERAVEVPRPPTDVWRAVADVGRLGFWLGGDLDVEIRPGGRGSFSTPDGVARRVFVLAVDEGHELCFRWWPATDVGDASTVTITVEERGDGTSTVRVRETRAQVVSGARAARRWSRRERAA